MMHLFQCIDGGRMQERICGAYAAMSVDGMIMCSAEDEAKVGRDAPPVSMANLLLTSLTGGQAIQAAPPALVIRVENIYDLGGQDYFAVDARADWSIDEW